jgi:hypothetical protein
LPLSAKLISLPSFEYKTPFSDKNVSLLGFTSQYNREQNISHVPPELKSFIVLSEIEVTVEETKIYKVRFEIDSYSILVTPSGIQITGKSLL